MPAASTQLNTILNSPILHFRFDGGIKLILRCSKLMAMYRTRRRAVHFAVLAACFALAAIPLKAQSSRDEIAPPETSVASLQLSPEIADRLQKAIDGHDYLTAEKLLLAEIDREAHSA